MAKRSNYVVPSVVGDGLDIVDTAPYNIVEQSVQIECQYPATIAITGQATGKQYVWMGAGAVVEVDQADAEDVLKRKMGQRSCCGSAGQGNVIFRVVGG